MEGRENSYIMILRTLASTMSGYDDLEAERRRDIYDEILQSALEAEHNITAIFTVWKPNAIDGLDSHARAGRSLHYG